MGVRRQMGKGKGNKRERFEGKGKVVRGVEGEADSCKTFDGRLSMIGDAAQVSVFATFRRRRISLRRDRKVSHLRQPLTGYVEGRVKGEGDWVEG